MESPQARAGCWALGTAARCTAALSAAAVVCCCALCAAALCYILCYLMSLSQGIYFMLILEFDAALEVSTQGMPHRVLCILLCHLAYFLFAGELSDSAWLTCMSPLKLVSSFCSVSLLSQQYFYVSRSLSLYLSLSSLLLFISVHLCQHLSIYLSA